MADGFSRLQMLQGRKFLYSVKQSDMGQVKKLCFYGVPNIVNQIIMPEGECGIHAAVKKADIDMILLLIELHASVDRRDSTGRTPMMIAVDYGYDHVLGTLLEANSNINACDNKGHVVLWYTLKPTQRHLRCLEKLCKEGANVNAADNTRETLLMKCAVMGLAAATEVLLNHGVDTDATNSDNVTALFMAIKHNKARVVELLLRGGCSTDVIDTESCTPIHICAREGYTALLTMLLNHGGEPDTMSNTGDTPLHLAVQHKHHAAVKVLLSRGVQTEVPNYSAITPRNIAHQMKDKVMKRLLRRHENGIHKACEQGIIRAGKDYWRIVLLKWNRDNYDDLMSMFVQYDAMGNGECGLESFINILRQKNVPLSDRKLAEVLKSSRGGQVDYVQYLQGRLFIKLLNYDNYARRKKKKKKGKGRKGKKKKIQLNIMVEKKRITPFVRSEDVVEKMEHYTDTARFTRDAPPKTFIEDDSSWYLSPPTTTYIRVHKAAQLGDLKTIEAACEDLVDLNLPDRFCKTPLMIACSNGRCHIVDKLLAYGVEVNTQDNFRWTALHHACHASHGDITEMLVSYHADIDAQALSGGTPLMRAVESGSVEIVRLLLHRGAKVTLRTKHEKTALDIAYEWGSTEIIDLITNAIAERQLVKKRKKTSARSAGSARGETDVKAELEMDSKSTVTFALPERTEMALSKSAIQFNQSLSDADDTFRSASAPPDLTKSVHSPRRRTNAWAHAPPTTIDLLNYKVERRKRFGFEVADFQKPRSPFTSVLEDKMRTYVLVKSNNRPISS